MLRMIFSVWLRTSSNPADINRFQSHTGKSIFFSHEFKSLREAMQLKRVYTNQSLKWHGMVKTVFY